MASLYANWSAQPTPAAQLVMLQMHIGEVGATLASIDVSGDGKATDRKHLTAYYASLLSERDKLQGDPAATGAINGGTSLARMRRER